MRIFVGTVVSLVTVACVSIVGNLPVRRGVPLVAVEVAQGGAVLWRVESSRPEPQIELRYGIVPVGFTQVVPVAQFPRVLVPGEPLTVRYDYVDSRIELQAEAVSQTGLRATGYDSTAPREPRR